MRRQREIVSTAIKEYFSLDTTTGEYVSDQGGLLPGLSWETNGLMYRIVLFNMDLTMMQNQYVNFVYSIYIFSEGNEWVADRWNVVKTSQVTYTNSTYVNSSGDEVPPEEAIDPETGELNPDYYRQLDYFVGKVFKENINGTYPSMYDFVIYDISAVEGLLVE